MPTPQNEVLIIQRANSLMHQLKMSEFDGWRRGWNDALKPHEAHDKEMKRLSRLMRWLDFITGAATAVTITNLISILSR